MERKSFGGMTRPITRGLEHVGEWWSMLILRNAFAGLGRLDEFQRSLGIAPNMLTRRLATPVEAGLLEHRRYSARLPRDEYVLTDQGRDFRGLLMALLAFGNRHFAPEGASVVVTGTLAEPGVVDRCTGRLLTERDFTIAAGPAAPPALQTHLARARPTLEGPAA